MDSYKPLFKKMLKDMRKAKEDKKDEQVKWKTNEKGKKVPYSDKPGHKVDEEGNEVPMTDKEKEEEKKKCKK